MTRMVFIGVLILSSFCATSQYVRYKPMEVYNENSSQLIYELKQQRKRELESQNYPEGSNAGAIYRESTKYLIFLINNELIINDLGLTNYLLSINERLAASNPEIKNARKILVRREGFLNATSYGEGTITLNIGLIANAKSEDEIAFVMAHEIGHFHLNHLRGRIESHHNRQSTRAIKRRLNKISEGALTLEDLEVVQTWFNTLFMNSREDEMEADSLAVQMIKNAGYNFNGGVKALSDLKSVYQPVYPLGSNLFDEFIFDELPFKRRWLNPEKIILDDNIHLEHLVNNDSIASHPDTELRLGVLSSYEYDKNTPLVTIPDTISRKSRLELVETFYSNNFYDLGIHTSLQLKKIEPLQSYLDFQISRMLYEIALAKNDKRLPVFVRRDNSLFPDESKALNNFFYNLTTAEAAEISYLFLKKNFDPLNPDQYSVLHKILLLTNRMEEDRQLRREFKKMFPGKNINRYLKIR